MLYTDLSHIEYFKNKNIRILPNIYLNDKYPSCFLVECENQYFKIRMPSEFNDNAIACEIKALQILNPVLNHMIPQIIESNYSSANEAYIVESFLPGKSVDKLTEKEIKQNSKTIVEQLYYFIDNLYGITANGHGRLDAPFYRCYKDWLIDKLMIHISFFRKSEVISKEILDKICNLFFNTTIFREPFSHFLHFDLKPQNLIYDKVSRRLFVVDFEFSRFGDIEHEIFRAEKKSSLYPVFTSEILFPVIEQYINSKKITRSEDKIFLFSIYYYLSELTCLLKKKESSNAENTIKLLVERLSEI